MSTPSQNARLKAKNIYLLNLQVISCHNLLIYHIHLNNANISELDKLSSLLKSICCYKLGSGFWICQLRHAVFIKMHDN